VPNDGYHPLARCTKKRAEGKTERAALRCLKRRLVDVVFRLLRPPVPTERAAEVALAV